MTAKATDAALTVLVLPLVVVAELVGFVLLVSAIALGEWCFIQLVEALTRL